MPSVAPVATARNLFIIIVSIMFIKTYRPKFCRSRTSPKEEWNVPQLPHRACKESDKIERSHRKWRHSIGSRKSIRKRRPTTAFSTEKIGTQQNAMWFPKGNRNFRKREDAIQMLYELVLLNANLWMRQGDSETFLAFSTLFNIFLKKTILSNWTYESTVYAEIIHSKWRLSTEVYMEECRKEQTTLFSFARYP